MMASPGTGEGDDADGWDDAAAADGSELDGAELVDPGNAGETEGAPDDGDEAGVTGGVADGAIAPGGREVEKGV
ncbi:MAG: hypothetical protein J0I83_06980 [Nitrobacter sp.]|nr:hypothetical protein [Nitrobacter sp.]